ncbi:CPBP family intramembrane glutamic endopeptidase [Chengkuizengella axinellae]|uniref:CPBP family intramembrane metalloprotease n=1 Tax=Chengkuizengella axinellae TaxID=3064388 RepID=A0ABT9IXJ9_9BACL|nr:CPBP family intramembrane glutamic endopeptidase [Chengkuizengella sp. 2205SS18-9]MDP5273842.1 CPBP family intramembrane metalloprotease [Chengkuizengella sp. 2205SS18-9]
MSERASNTLLQIIGKVLLSLFFALFITFILIIISVFIYLLISRDDAALQEVYGNSITLSDPLFLVLYAPQAIGFILAAYLMVFIFERNKNWNLGLKQNDGLKLLLKGFIIGIILMSMTFLIIWILGGIKVESINTDPGLWIQLSLALIIFILTAVNEEIFCRGYLQGLFRFHYGIWPAVISSSLLFSGLHAFNAAVLDSPIPLLNIFLAGVLLAISREVSGGLWLPIGIHLTWNYFQGNIYGFEVSGTEMNSWIQISSQGSTLLNGGLFGAEGSIVATFILLAGIISMIRYQKKLS